MAQNMNQANIDQLGAWRAAGNTGDLPVGWQASGGGGGGVGGAPNYADLARQQIDLQKEANKPAIDSLEASKPEIAAKYASAKTTAEGRRGIYEDKYNQLLDQIKSTGEKETNVATKNTSREFGRRGVSLSSTAFGDELQGVVNPIEQFYTGQRAAALTGNQEANLSLDELIANLTSGEVSDTRAIQNAIAQLTAGGTKDAIGNATSLYNTGISSMLQQNDLSETAKQNAITNALAQRTFNEVTLPASNASIAKSNASSSSGSGLTAAQLLAQIYGQTPTLSTPKSFKLDSTGGGRSF